ncbi:hypothetical protein M1N88_02135 [Dehalococcoidia bacterium]|nr:hypothetical protein [Dehalococcoidia bacterium]
MDKEGGVDLIGLFKKLKSTEELSFETKIVTPVIFLKEVEFRRLGMHCRQEIPISLCQANVYLTNERLLFLVLYQLEVSTVAERGESKVSRLSGVSGTWFEMPLSAIQQVEMRPLKLLKGKEMERLFESIYPDRGERDNFLKSPAVELIYDEQAAIGRVKDYMVALLRMGLFGRMFTKLDKVYDKLVIVGEEIVSITSTLRGIV